MLRGVACSLSFAIRFAAVIRVVELWLLRRKAKDGDWRMVVMIFQPNINNENQKYKQRQCHVEKRRISGGAMWPIRARPKGLKTTRSERELLRTTD